jgi:hypothetical protein
MLILLRVIILIAAMLSVVIRGVIIPSVVTPNEWLKKYRKVFQKIERIILLEASFLKIIKNEILFFLLVSFEFRSRKWERKSGCLWWANRGATSGSWSPTSSCRARSRLRSAWPWEGSWNGMDKLQLNRQNLGKVFSSWSVCVHGMQLKGRAHLQLTRQNPGRVFNSRSSRVHAM